MSHKIFDNDSVVIRKNKVILKLNKPAYMGIFIFELCKVLMYEFHYDYIKNKFGNKARLLRNVCVRVRATRIFYHSCFNIKKVQ